MKLPAIIESLCVRYLKKRGRVVLPRMFVGMAFGNCEVHERDNQLSSHARFDVFMPRGGGIIALNHTMVLTKSGGLRK